MKRMEVEPTVEQVLNSISNNIGGRNEEIIGFIKLLESIEGPFTIMLDAQWGDGKTFFINSVITTLKSLNSNLQKNKNVVSEIQKLVKQTDKIDSVFLPFYFNAWEHDYFGDPLSPLFSKMATDFNQKNFTTEIDLSNLFTQIADSVLSSLSLLPPNISITQIKNLISGNDLIQSYREYSHLREKIDELANKIASLKIGKLVIFIDELDRCRPDFSIHLLEQIKTLFNSDNIIVVLSVDSAQLAHAAAGVYGSTFDTQRFLEKFYDLKVILNHIDPNECLAEKLDLTSSDYFNKMTLGLLNATGSSIRSMIRVMPKIKQAQHYVISQEFETVFETIAYQIVIPLLIFINRDNPALFRKITQGDDFDALYSYGLNFEIFSELVRKIIAFPKIIQGKDYNFEVKDDECREYFHYLCVLLFSKNRTFDFINFAKIKLDLDPFKTIKINNKIFKQLEFSNNATPLYL